MKAPRPSTWMSLGLIVLVVIAYTWATWRYFTIQVPGGNDFIARYMAWEAYFEHGYSPYSDEAAVYTQQAIRGRPSQPGEDQDRLTYPFYSALIHAPFILLDYALARAIFMVLSQIALIASLGLSLWLLRWHPPFWMLLLLVAWSIIYYPHARGIILGQFAILGCFSLVGALALLQRGGGAISYRFDILAGFLLVLSTIKPTLVFLVIPFLLLWSLSRRRWAFLIAFLGLLGLLFFGSFLFLPTWLSEFLYRVNAYRDYTVGQSPVWLLTHQAVPVLGVVGEWVIVLLLLAGMLWAWWKTLRSGGEFHFYWALSITLIVSNLIVSRSATTNYVMLLLPTLWVLAALDRRGIAGRKPWGRWLVLLFLMASFVGLWALHFATVQGNQEQAILYIPTPVLLGFVFLVCRAWLEFDARQVNLVL